MGAELIALQYSAQPLDRNLLFGFGPVNEIKLDLFDALNSVTFFVSYAKLAAAGRRGPSSSRPGPEALDRWPSAAARVRRRRDGLVRALSSRTM